VKAGELRALQAPLKERYRAEPEVALVTLRASGRLDGEGLTCKLDTGRALVEAGLHPATGGDGLSACSGDMLLEALVACAGGAKPAETLEDRAILRVAGRIPEQRVADSAVRAFGAQLKERSCRSAP
jgi:hypothetical protein